MSKWKNLVLTTQEKDKSQWKTLVEKLGLKSVNYSPEYSQIFENSLGYQAHLFFYGDADNYIVYPFWKIKINDLDFYKSQVNQTKDPTIFYDVLSPEYTGPSVYLTSPNLKEELISGFFHQFHVYCGQENIVTEFIRIDPLSNTLDFWEDKEGLVNNRQIVYVDLRKDLDTIWAEFQTKTRGSCKKSQREGVKIFHSHSQQDFDTFFNIYTSTMERRNAKEDYFFPHEFFCSVSNLLKENATVFIAEHNMHNIAASLFLHQYDVIFYHLSGMLKDFSPLCPTNAILYEVIKWGKEKGYKYFILGGGYQPDDGIFRFKKSFSQTTFSFFTYKKIHLEETYQQLCTLKRIHDQHQEDLNPNGYGFFPEYRK